LKRRYEHCDCVSPFLWNDRSIHKPGTNELFVAPLCNTTNKCCQKAIDTLWTSSDLMEKYCSDCSLQSSLTNFAVQASSFAAPPDWQLRSIKAFVENASIPLTSTWARTWSIDIANNYVFVHII
ncbi:unnamed protein product, partial [Rotaria sp. Silwood2]